MTDSGVEQGSGPGERARVSQLAMAAMVIGVAGILGALVGIGPILGLLAFGLGAVAISEIKKHPLQLGGLGYAQAGLVLGLIAMPLGLIGPALDYAIRDGRGASCAANVTGTVKGFVVYANDNFDVFPTAGLPTQERGYSAALGTVSTATDPDTALLQIQSATGARGNPWSAMWMLVLRSQETPKNLICPQDPRASSTPPPVTMGGHYLLNPAQADQISYSIAYPYASQKEVGGWWKNTTLSDLPVMSDMAPLNGTGSPKRNLLPVGTPWDIKTVNSANHNGDGQYVGYADAHCEWRTNPLAGEKDDNIWTVGKVDPLVGGYTGDVLKGREVPRYSPTAAPPYDTMMVPVRDLESGEIR